jgi:hypothetical protein
MKKVILSIISLLFSVSLLVYAVFAWFTFRTEKGSFIITTGNVKVSATLYKGQDFDFDGFVDVDETGTDIYTLVDTEQSSLLSDINPGDIVTFKLHIVNEGSLDGQLTVKFSDFEGDLAPVMIYDDGDLSEGDRLYGNEAEVIATSGTVIAAGETGNTYDFIFRLKFATLEELKSITAWGFAGYDNLNAFESSTEETKNFGMLITVVLMQSVDS